MHSLQGLGPEAVLQLTGLPTEVEGTAVVVVLSYDTCMLVIGDDLRF